MMTRDKQSELRERLLAEQSMDPKLKSEYERKLKMMFEIQLPVWKKLMLVSLTGFALAAGTTAMVLGLTESQPGAAARTVLLVGSAFAVSWVVFFVQMLYRGTLRRRIDRPIAAGMAFVFSLLMCVLLAIGGLPTDRVILIAVLFLIPAGLMVLRAMVEQSEMRMQEQLVELQYRIARLSERLDEDGEAGAAVRR